MDSGSSLWPGVSPELTRRLQALADSAVRGSGFGEGLGDRRLSKMYERSSVHLIGNLRLTHSLKRPKGPTRTRDIYLQTHMQ